jgi:hypothetical protein
MTSMADLLEKYGSFEKVPAAAWDRMEANRADLQAREQAEREAARGDRSHERSLLDEWEGNDHGLSEEDIARRHRLVQQGGTLAGPAHLDTFKRVAQLHEGGETHLREVFAAYHQYGPREPKETYSKVGFLFAMGISDDWAAVWDNSGRERGQGRLAGLEDCESAESKAERIIKYVMGWYAGWLERRQPSGPTEAVPPATPAKRKRATKAEMNRRRGAEYTRRSRAKHPATPKPKRTHADYLRAAEKSLATRLNKLAKLNAAFAGTGARVAGLADQIIKCEAGIRRCREDIEHYRNRAEAAAAAEKLGTPSDWPPTKLVRVNQ